MRIQFKTGKLLLAIAFSAVLLLYPSNPVFAQGGGKTKITIVNLDGPGEGFNDPSARLPVGGNFGTTLGQQRLNVFQRAANIWASTLDSNVEILVEANFDPLTCTATSAVLGSAGTIVIIRDFAPIPPFPGPEFPSTFYHTALANKRAGTDLVPPGTVGVSSANDIRARFNSNIGLPGCLTGSNFYLGLDSKPPTGQIDLLVVVLHELAHGLGFSQFASVSTGAQPGNSTDVYGRRILDLSTGKHWNEMTNSERIASAINSRRVVWDGETVTGALPGVLSLGVPLLKVNPPSAIAGVFAVGTAQFGPPLSSPGVTSNIVLAIDAANASGPSTTDGCTAITNASAIAGKIALIDRGTCGFAVKVKNAQLAGAIGVVIADNLPGAPPAGMAGVDATINIPSARVSLKDGTSIKARLTAGEAVNGTLSVDLTVRAGADPNGRALLNAPDPVQPGSSISHWDPVTSRNQLMEPAINGDLTQSVKPPEDLTLPLMRDVGWFADSDTDGFSNDVDQCDDSDLSPTVVIDGCDTGVANVLFSTGCTISDNIMKCAANARNHGDFVSCVAAYTNQLVSDGIITGEEKGKIQSCAAHSKLP